MSMKPVGHSGGLRIEFRPGTACVRLRQQQEPGQSLSQQEPRQSLFRKTPEAIVARPASPSNAQQSAGGPSLRFLPGTEREPETAIVGIVYPPPH